VSLLTTDIMLAAGAQPDAADRFLVPLGAAFDEFSINTPQRTAMILAQLAWESERFTKTAEVGTADGSTWQGFGLIQLTGQWNQQACARYFDLPTNRSAIQAWLQTPEGACRSAGWFLNVLHSANVLCDDLNFTGLTKLINGGLNGLQGRLDAYQPIAVAMGLLPSPES
jgi:putative chitinase